MAEVRKLAPEERPSLAPLLDPRSAADAMAAYFALEHPAERVTLFGYFPRDERPRGFLALARTGLDLFRPVAVPLVGHPSGLNALLHAALGEGGEALLYLPVEQRGWLDRAVALREPQVMELLRLDPQAYTPVINVLVVEGRSPDGLPRYEIRSGNRIHAAAGLNWRGERFAEVYVTATSEGRRRSFSKSVLAAMAGRLLGERRVALYRVAEDDLAGRTEAYRLGFRSTGVRTLVAAVTWEPQGRSTR